MPAPPLYGLLYVSQARPLTEADLGALMRQARDRNASMGVTGVLVALYPAAGTTPTVRCERFVQWLEGSRAAIEKLMASIRKDLRHHDVRVVWEGERTRRLCPDWRMALRWREDADFLSALVAMGVELHTDLPVGLPDAQVEALVYEAAQPRPPLRAV